jgi:hypothetical protein
MNRAGFLLLGVQGSAALALGPLAVTARAAGPLGDLDLALARLAVGLEILSAAFYSQALKSKKLGPAETNFFRRALFNEGEHLGTVSGILTGAGQTPSTPDDFSISFPRGTFDSVGTIAKLGLALENTTLGFYLGAVDSFGPPDLKTTAARIAASESQHVGVLSGLAANRPVGVSFPAPLSLEAASDAIDPYFG